MTFDNDKPQVLIIGAGIGGIAAAARLARRGYPVTVVEKNEQPGGRCGTMKVNGYQFDTGATLFLMRELYAETFTALGERMEDYLDLRRVDPTYHLHFRDGSRMQLTSDLSAMQAQMEAIEPGSFGDMLRYLEEGRRHYKLSMPHLVGRDFRRLTEFINPRMIRLFLQLKALTRHTTYAARFFEDCRLQMAFTFHDMYMGLSPFESPATYSFLQYTELADGLWFPMGGVYGVIRALTAIAEKHGVCFLFNAAVEKILIDGERAAGVELTNGGRLLADVIVANADLSYVYRHLLPDDGMARRIESMEYGCSTLMFYWGLDRQYPQLGLHNLFLCGDYRRGFEAIFEDLTMPDEPNFYVHAPVRLDASLAPEGHDALSVAVPVGHLDEENPQDWLAMQSRARVFILERLAQAVLENLESHIQTEISFTPTDWQGRYNLWRGSVHGLSHRLTQMGYFRPHNQHPRWRNLYFVGAGTHPGTGLPTVLVSARLVTERILRDTGGCQ